MSDTYMDGIAAGSFGSRVLVIGGVTYVAESFSYEEGSTTIETRSEVGVPNGVVDVVTNPTGSATLQYPAAGPTSAEPARFEVFAANIKGTSTSMVLLTVGMPETQGDVKKVSITFRKKLGS